MLEVDNKENQNIMNVVDNDVVPIERETVMVRSGGERDWISASKHVQDKKVPFSLNMQENER